MRSFSIILLSVMFCTNSALAAGCESAINTTSELSKYTQLDPDSSCAKLREAKLDQVGGVTNDRCYESICMETYAKIKQIAEDYAKGLKEAATKVQAACRKCTAPAATAGNDSQKKYFQCLLDTETTIVQPALTKLNDQLTTAKDGISKLEDKNKEIAQRYLDDKAKIDAAIDNTKAVVANKVAQADSAVRASDQEVLIAEANKLKASVDTAASVTGSNLVVPEVGTIKASNGGPATVKEYAAIAQTLSDIQNAAKDTASNSQSSITTEVKNNVQKIDASAMRASDYRESLNGLSRMDSSAASKNPFADSTAKGADTGRTLANASGNGGGGAALNGAGDKVSGDPAVIQQAASQKPPSSAAAGSLGALGQAAGALAAAKGQGQGSPVTADMAGAALAQAQVINKSSSASKIAAAGTAATKPIGTVAATGDAGFSYALGSGGAAPTTGKRSFNRSGSSSMAAVVGVSGGGSGAEGFSNKDMPRELASGGPMSGKDQLVAAVGGGGGLNTSGSADLGLSSFDADSSGLTDLMGEQKKIGSDALGGLSGEERYALGLGEGSKSESRLGENSLLGMDSEPLFNRTRAAALRAMKRGNVIDNMHMKSVLK